MSTAHVKYALSAFTSPTLVFHFFNDYYSEFVFQRKPDQTDRRQLADGQLASVSIVRLFTEKKWKIHHREILITKNVREYLKNEIYKRVTVFIVHSV